ncbi:MAG TPA: alpha/beta hydrolase [Chitinophagaceae bacterium]|nr:alpha/beta hydrolase [Chitinophagaceae bacterium]
MKSGYSNVNGLKMYYEIYGQGQPLVLIHGGGSTIQTSFSNIIPYLSKDRQLIAMDLQAHGRTADRNTPLSFQQDADDIAALLKNLNINKADFLGFSNGGQTAIEIALRHPNIVNKLILASTFYKRSAAPPQFWEGFDKVTLSVMPKPLQDAFLAVNNSQDALQNMFDRDVQRMKTFKDWSDEQISSIKMPTLIMNGNMDVGSADHAVEMHRRIQGSTLVILPGYHGQYIGTSEGLPDGEWKQKYTVNIITDFLDQ